MTKKVRIRLSTSASGSQPSGNTRNDRIRQTSSSNSKNKVEAHPRNDKSSLNKRNVRLHVSDNSGGTQPVIPNNRSMIRRRHGKTPYEILHDKPPDLSYLHVFGALCYPTNDSENLGKLQTKADIGIFIGYAPTKKAFWIYNRRTRRIIKTINVYFDELTAMASEHNSSGPALHK
ncbi:retrovirus-related pol polyprotein from transposon TNT 1-94 [Tanacetum coccineum]